MSKTKYVPDGVKLIRPFTQRALTFSICAMMTDPDQYASMVESYRQAGFDKDCEFLCIDNSAGNTLDAYKGYNAFLNEAKGDYVILTHQDVQLDFDKRDHLQKRLAELTGLDPAWGACGNSGGTRLGKLAMRISDPHGEDRVIGELPSVVTALDENFIVARRDANLCLSDDLSGFHMYGADLCVMAAVKGHKCYVIDFHLRHLSGGKLDHSFTTSARAFAEKYTRAFKPRWVQTTVTAVYLSGGRLRARVITSALGRRLGLGR